MTTYKGYFVLEDDPNSRDGLSFGIRRRVEGIANPIGNPEVIDRDTERVSAVFSNIIEGKAAVWSFVTEFLPSLAGRRNAIWVPSNTKDFVPAFQYTSDFAYYDDGISDMWNLGHHRRYLYARWINTSSQWQTWANKWNAMGVLPGNYVVLAPILSPIDFGTGLANRSLKLSRMYLMRLDSDDVEVEWLNSETIQVSLRFIEVPRAEYPTSGPPFP